MNARVESHFQSHMDLAQQTKTLQGRIVALASDMANALRQGGKVIWFGNGGSAAEAQHLSAELVGRYAKEREGFASIALSTDTSALTAIANDYGYEAVFARQVQALCEPTDVVIGLTTSGNSPNVVNALREAQSVGATTAAMTGGSASDLIRLDHLINVPSSSTPRIQEMHALIGHILCDFVEHELTT